MEPTRQAAGTRGTTAPDYACAIIRDPARGFLLEHRGTDARHAAGRCTCFGGRREGGETSRACLLRELDEELGWQPAAAGLRFALALHVRGVHIADFFAVEGFPPDPIRCRISGRGALWLKDPADERISPWHREVLISWISGEEVCRYAG